MKFHETWPWPRPKEKTYWIISNSVLLNIWVFQTYWFFSSCHRPTHHQDLLSSFFLGIDWFDSWAFGLDYQALWYSDRELKSSIKWIDYQVIWHYHLIISDSAMWKRLQNVYSQKNVKTFTTRLLTNQTNQTKATESHHHRWILICHHKSAIWYWFLPSMCFPASCPWSFSWDHHAVFQLK